MGIHEPVWSCTDCDKRLIVCDATSVIRCPECGATIERRSGIWHASPGFVPGGFGADRREHLHQIESDHFWFPPRRDLLLRKARERLPAAGGRVLEIGCGSGAWLTALEADAGASSAPRASVPVADPPLRVGVEGHLESLERARERSADPVWIHGDGSRLPLTAEQFDLVACFDVLEHVEPEPLLHEAFRLARPGGALLLSVPAFPSLWSAHDAAAGHRLRYRLAGLRAELDAAGWRFEGHTHYQCLLFPLVWSSRAAHRLRSLRTRLSLHPRDADAAGPRLERQPPAWVGRCLGALNDFEVNALAGWTLPFGSSLVAWARRPG